MTSTRFDPLPGEAYGSCVDCGISLATSDDADAHRRESYRNGSSHTTRGTNPDRERRIQSHVNDVVSMAIADALDDLQGDIDNGHITEEEMVDALRWHSDFADAWKDNS